MAWSLTALTLAVLAADLVLVALNTRRTGASRIGLEAFLSAAVLMYAGSGRLIAGRVPGNAIGWLLGSAHRRGTRGPDRPGPAGPHRRGTGGLVRRPAAQAACQPLPASPFPASPFPASPFPASPFPASPGPLSPGPLQAVRVPVVPVAIIAVVALVSILSGHPGLIALVPVLVLVIVRRLTGRRGRRAPR